MSGGITANYGLQKPDFNSKPWDEKINDNFDLIDTILYTIAQVPNIGGLWRNSMAYTVGQNVLDPQSLVFYQCLLANTSAASGTFAADRTANPLNWTLTTPQQGALRFDQGQVLSDAQKGLALGNLGLINASQILSAPATLGVGYFNVPLIVTGTTTITVGNNGIGWYSGPILNDNSPTGIVTLAVPSGATLDGVLNGSLQLWVKQVARIKQVGATAYRVEWIDRTPVLAIQNTSGAVASIDFAIPDGYNRFRVRGNGISLAASADLGFRIGDAGGIKTGASDYVNTRTQSFATTVQGRSVTTSYGLINAGELDNTSSSKANIDFEFCPGYSGVTPNFLGQSYYFDNVSPRIIVQSGIEYIGTAIARATTLRILGITANISGNFTFSGEV